MSEEVVPAELAGVDERPHLAHDVVALRACQAVFHDAGAVRVHGREDRRVGYRLRAGSIVHVPQLAGHSDNDWSYLLRRTRNLRLDPDYIKTKLKFRN